MAYSDNFPATRPVFMADFANGGKIDPRATFSRPDSPINSSNAPASAVHYWSNEKSLSSENLLSYSNPNGAAWDESNNATIATNVAAAPDGTTTASSIVEDSANSQHRTFASINATSGQTYTLVAYLKANGRTIAQVATSGAGAAANVEFDLSGSGTATTRSGSPANSSISQIGSTGWYKCSFQVTAGSTATLYLNVYLCDSANSNSYTGDGSSGVYAYGFNLSSIGQLVHEDTSGQIARSYAPKLKSVATAGAARFEYDPETNVSRGILIEGQSTNLATYGSDLTNAAWNPLSAFIGGTAVGPDGTLSAVKLVASAGSGLAPRFRRLSLLTDTTQTFSIYVKPLEFQHLAISADGSTACMVLYNLSGSGAITSATGATGTVEQCGNGWFRLSYSYTTTPSLHLAITMQSSTTYQTETGNGYDGMLFALAMLENSSHASSFIGTTSSTATRASDSLSIATADIGYTGGPVALFAESSTQSPSENPHNRGVVDLSEPSSSNNRVMIYNLSGQAGGLFVNADNSQQAAVAGGVTDDSYSKVCVSVDTNSVKHCVNGGTVTTDTSAVIPEGMTKLFIGQTRSGEGFGGHIKRVAIYPALTDTNLQALTS